ncbi:MAG: hypothetical protein ACXVEC_12125 [Nocardioides sp.]
MTPPPRRHLPSSPFQPDPEPVIEVFEQGDLVQHDAYGVGRVVALDPGAVTVDFGDRTVRVPSPFRKLSKL